MKSFHDLEIFQLAFDFALDIHHFTMKLPKYEMFEQGNQIRRSSQSIKDNIAEGFGRRRYKSEFIRFLIFAQSSCDESFAQLKMINVIHFQNNPNLIFIDKNVILGKKINRFILYVEKNWKTRD